MKNIINLRERMLLTGILGIFLAHSYALAACGPQPEGNCVECGPHPSAWTLDYCPSLNDSPSPSVSPGSICQKQNDALTMPTVVAPTYSAGQKEMHKDYDCKAAEYQYAAISYTVGSVQWDPALPGMIPAGGITSTAYVNVASSDTSLCPSPGRVDIGTCTWGYYSCDNPHAINDLIWESGHFTPDTNEACSTTQCIRDVINTSTCDTHAGSTCAGICNLKDGPAGEVVQDLYAAACPGGNGPFVNWYTVNSGCTDCGANTYRVRCTFFAPQNPVHIDGPSNRGNRKVPCS